MAEELSALYVSKPGFVVQRAVDRFTSDYEGVRYLTREWEFVSAHHTSGAAEDVADQVAEKCGTARVVSREVAGLDG